jgi:predicted nicotinamide N-methyase
LVDGYKCEEVEVFMGLGEEDLDPIVVLEADSGAQEELVNVALEAEKGDSKEDPYGAVLWPAAYSVSKCILGRDLQSTKVLELGCGTGLVSLTAVLSGAKKVVASDYNPLTLSLLEKAMTLQRKSLPTDALELLQFDVKDLSTPLPDADLIVIADLLYDASLGIAVAHRIKEAVDRGTKVIIGDSPGRPGRPYMLEKLKELLPDKVCDFKTVDGYTINRERHSMISTSTTQDPKTISISILEV